MACFFLWNYLQLMKKATASSLIGTSSPGENLRQSAAAGDLHHLCSGAHPPMGACDV
jgi:hypothetical protein